MIHARRIFAGMFPLSGKSCYNEKFLEDASLPVGRQGDYNG